MFHCTSVCFNEIFLQTLYLFKNVILFYTNYSMTRERNDLVVSTTTTADICKGNVLVKHICPLCESVLHGDYGMEVMLLFCTCRNCIADQFIPSDGTTLFIHT